MWQFETCFAFAALGTIAQVCDARNDACKTVARPIINLMLLKIDTMTTKEMASRLVDLWRNGKVEEAKEELFAHNVISLEPAEGILPKETKGMEATRKKAELFISFVEHFYGSTISDPVIAGDYFSIAWDTDCK
ncbi:hypothetical protein BH10BAC2_BH10BAC2_04460 [soil metagenome]